MGLVALVTLAPLALTGCIIAEAPDYGNTPRSPVFMSQPFPNPGSLQVLSTQSPSGTTSFQVTVRSEDAGDDLVSALYGDYKHTGEFLYNWHIHPPQTFEQERHITYPVSPADPRFIDRPCHTITLMVMHFDSWDQTKSEPKASSDDLASMTWFVSIDDDGSATLKECPTSSSETP